MDFTAIDFETANADLASICQLGAVSFQDGKAVKIWQTLINPEDYFDTFNVSIHGINEDMVKDAPTFRKIFETLRSIIEKQLVACHTHFDRVALDSVIEKYQLPQIDCTWLDTARITRRAWGKFSHVGYGLKNVANELGIGFNHHVAGEDARAAGEILLRAITETGISLQDWLIRVDKRITQETITREGNPEGPLAGEVVVFTGALSMHRHQAANYAAGMGCEVADSVSKTTTILVVGNQDIRRLAGHEKSSKHRKAEELITKGQPIRIIGESDFLRFVKVNSEPISTSRRAAPDRKVETTFPAHTDPSSQVVGKNHYVYVHRDSFGNIFYVGKGTGRRAWSQDRDILWKRYVDERSIGRFEVEIIKSNLSGDEAEELKCDLINEHGKNLVNWVNPGRQFDYANIDRYHALRDANRLFIKRIRRLEGKDPEQAIIKYREALDRLREYENLVLERGLVTELNNDEKHGEPTIIDRLTLCLTKLERFNETITEAERYFGDFSFDRNLSAGKRTLERIEGLKSK